MRSRSRPPPCGHLITRVPNPLCNAPLVEPPLIFGPYQRLVRVACLQGLQWAGEVRCLLSLLNEEEGEEEEEQEQEQDDDEDEDEDEERRRTLIHAGQGWWVSLSYSSIQKPLIAQSDCRQ